MAEAVKIVEVHDYVSDEEMNTNEIVNNENKEKVKKRGNDDGWKEWYLTMSLNLKKE